MNLRHHLGRLRRSVLCTFFRRSAPLGNHGPIISFTFDDFPRSALSVGGSILEQFGARGTYYVTGGLMNACTELGELFNAEDLCTLVAKGHELGTQTFHHSSCRKVSWGAFREDVKKGMKAVEHIRGHNSTNFAYPYGHVTLRSKKSLGPALASSRSNIPGLNGPEIDLNLLRANRLYGGVENSPAVEELISQNVKQKSWLIFYTHDVRRNPSRYGCTPELFERAVSLAASSGGRIVTVQKAVAEIGLRTPSAEIEFAEQIH
ncbi:MAG: polysaccharide deacetylase family protein [Candidatus Sulfotelmatobacter sp.]